MKIKALMLSVLAVATLISTTIELPNGEPPVPVGYPAVTYPYTIG
jgi:hypothetical protein